MFRKACRATVVLFTIGISMGDALAAQRPYRPPTPLGLDEYYPVPETNPLTRDKIELGRRLFFDPLLSADGTVACASCHQPELAFADTVAFSAGVAGRHAVRNTPSLFNRAYGKAMFFDARARTLEEAVLQPIQNANEMDLSLDKLVSRLRHRERYADEFARVFTDGVMAQNVARALASYVRTLRSGAAPIDRLLLGDRTALSSAARAGMRLFNGRANCVACHVGPTFSDEKLHNTGVSWGADDAGRYGVTALDGDRGAFKTPSLRNVALTAPYMHDGSLATLEDVIDFYVGGGTANPNLDPEISPLNLTMEEKRKLIALLRSLTGSAPER